MGKMWKPKDRAEDISLLQRLRVCHFHFFWGGRSFFGPRLFLVSSHSSPPGRSGRFSNGPGGDRGGGPLGLLRPTAGAKDEQLRISD